MITRRALLQGAGGLVLGSTGLATDAVAVEPGFMLDVTRYRIAPRAWLEGRAFRLRKGERLDRDAFRRRLDAAGYRAQSQVAEHGDFAVRGSVVDVFPMGSDAPFRIERGIQFAVEALPEFAQQL